MAARPPWRRWARLTPALDVAPSWFTAERLPDGVVRLWEPHVSDWLRANVFWIAGREVDLIVDSGCGIAPLAPELERLGRDPARPLVAVATHTHLDHIGGLHEFGERLVHPLEAGELSEPRPPIALTADQWEPDVLVALGELWPVPDVLIDALPFASFDPSTHRILAAPPTRLVDEGERIELGDRTFEVLHLPGHSPGSIGLLEERTGMLVAGDAVYDDDPVDALPDSDIATYLTTMGRLRELPLRVVHGGHAASFDRARLVEIADAYVASRA
jgi:glyoxylase-like metal-dependent hydrolase (beta-lactamase superfamily II)